MVVREPFWTDAFRAQPQKLMLYLVPVTERKFNDVENRVTVGGTLYGRYVLRVKRGDRWWMARRSEKSGR